jgi:serine/threonine protein kinase
MPTNGVAADGRSPQLPTATTKRRTTITAPSTGTWTLGKTIGAGSMGKVKLAKHSETGEQVCVRGAVRPQTTGCCTC